MHAKAFHEDSAVSVWVSLKLHGHGNVVANNCFFEWLRCVNSFAISHEDGPVSGGLDRCAWVPAELVAKGVVSLLSNRDATAVAFVADNFMSGGLCLVDNFHSPKNVDSRVEPALVQNNESFSLGLFVELEHFRGNVA